MMMTYRCKHPSVNPFPDSDGYRLTAVLLEYHENGLPPGATAYSSRLRSVDFERGIAVTQNSIYHWNPGETA